MAQVTFIHGTPTKIEYTPSGGNVTAGDVLLIGTVTANTAGTGALAVIADRDITNNTLGSVCVGGAVYAVTNLNNVANGAKVYWEDTNNKVTSVSTNNAKFGYVVYGGGGGANSTAYALHDPGHD